MARTNFLGPVNSKKGFELGGVTTDSVIVVDTDGTSAVSVFGTAGLTNDFIITGVSLISLDTTAGNITVENPADTVVTTIAKGTAAGVVVGGVAIANATVAAKTNVIVKSSSAGNARVSITYKTV